jgi:hypothetical protein
MFGFIKRIVMVVALFFTVLLVIFVINQTNQLVNFAAGISPALGQVVLYLLLAIYAAVIIMPLVAIYSKPPALLPPEDVESDEYKYYLRKLAARLAKNPHLGKAAVSPEQPEEIETALKKLDGVADEAIKNAASGVFIMTAISQYGALDAVIVIITQLRMIWQVTTLYNQRPTLRELAYLYGNVFATAFLATRIENLDLIEDQLEPIIASLMGSSLSSMTPGLNTAANIITNSVINGSANAFLTLRVGVITKQYCASLIRPERNTLRRAAMVQATALLAKVLSDSTYQVTRSILRATAKAGKRPFRYGHSVVSQATKKTVDAGKLTLKQSEELARKLGDAFKSGGRKLKFYLAGTEAEVEDSDPDN